MKFRVFVATLVTATVALAEDRPGSITATRIRDPIVIDGKLDEGLWDTTAAFAGFIESFPTAGKAPDFHTEARVLYDDAFLYIGVKCDDPNPEAIVRNLGRRDSTPFADLVEIAIDSNADQRTAYAFSVNAAGVLRDRLLFADFNDTDTWDAVWNGAASVTATGWSVEMAIPLRTLRFSSLDKPWGFQVRRTVPRTHQIFDSKLIPREANPNNPGAYAVSRFGTLNGLVGLKPGRTVELLAYAGARGTLRPQYSDPTQPEPRLFDPSLDVGVDFKLALTSNLLLTGTINPDFGQVEADQVIQNLSTQEAFFPEKRPFFLQGLDLFQSVGSEYGGSPQQMFYSRRIGLFTPILAAIKLTGSITDTLDVGFLDSVVLGAGNPSTAALGFGQGTPDAVLAAEASPNRQFQYHPATPLHFGVNDALPLERPVPTNYLAAVLRQRFAGTSSVGLIFTAATPLAERCSRLDFATEEAYSQAHCYSRGANALALDWNLRTGDGVWGFFGQLNASQQVGGDPNGRTLIDGTVMKPGDLGYGGNLRAGKLGGEPFRFDVTYVYLSPKLDLNAVGYQPGSNYQWADLNLHYVKPSGVGPFHYFSVDYNLDLNWSTDARTLPRGINTNVSSQVQFASYDWLGVRVGLELPQFDTREIAFQGVAFERLPSLFAGVFGNTDPNRKLFFEGDFFGYRMFALGVEAPAWGWGADARLIWHPIDALETRFDGAIGHKPQGARYIDLIEPTTALFGYQDPLFLSLTLRQQVVITPRLTFQVYAQLFSGAVRYGPFFAGSLASKAALPADALTATAYDGNANGHASALNLNAVLRWEYRLGSTLFFVYTHSQQERALMTGETPSASLLPSQLFKGPASDTFLIKFTYWWSV